MSPRDDAPINLKKAERAAVVYHERDTPDAADIWRDGLNILLRGLDPIRGQKIGSDEHPVLLALVMGAWQTLNCSFDLALRAHYVEALNLVRPPIEYWMAYWYLRSFPKDYQLFLDPSKYGAPRCQDSRDGRIS